MTRQIKDFGIPSIGAKIIADTNGTANKKTISVNVNCEMTVDDITRLIKALTNSLAWLTKGRGTK